MNNVTADEMRAVPQSQMTSIDHLFDDFDRLIQSPESVHRLRRFILDLAVRGKLAPQDPNDEPASELLKRIAAEKARLVKAGEIRKPKQLPTIDEPPYLLPDSWCWLPIREATSDRGQCVPQNSFTYIDVTAIDKEKGTIANPRVLESNEAPSRARKIVRKGDVVYSCVRPYLLNVAVVEDDSGPPPIASTAFAILHGHGCVLPRFQWIVLRSPFMVTLVEEEMRGQAYPAINDTDFSRLPFPLPPLAEQHRIVAKVDELMSLCDRLEAARADREATRDRLATVSLARLNVPDPEPARFQHDVAFALNNLGPLTTRPYQIKALRQTILNLAVRGKLVPQDPNDEPSSELLKRIAGNKARLAKAGKKKRATPPLPILPDAPFNLPVGWAWSTVGAVCSKTGSGSTPRGGKNTYREKGIAFIRSQNVYNDGLHLHDVAYIDGTTHAKMSETVVRPADLLLNITGGSMGRCCRVPDDFDEGNISQHVAIIRVAVVGLQNFVHLLILSPYFQSFIFGEQTGAGRGGLPKNKMDRIPVALPPLAEQHRIVAKVDELMALCDRLEASLTKGDDTLGHLIGALLREVLKPDKNREELAH